MSDYLDRLEAQLQELTERGAHRRWRLLPVLHAPRGPWRLRTEALAFAGAAAVVVAVVAVLLSVHSSAPRPNVRGPSSVSAAVQRSHASAHGSHKPSAASARPAAPVPRGFIPRSFTAISELTWWLLGDALCGTPPCTSIVRTTDGGRSFVGIPAPRASVAQLRFADTRDGFAFNPGLYITHDGGRTWHPVDVGGQVIDLAIGVGKVYAVVDSSPTAPGRLMSSAVGSDRWSELPTPDSVAGELWVHGRDVLVSSSGWINLLVSHDAGASFSSYSTPSPGLPCDIEEQAAPVLWAHCVTGTESAVSRSSDGGQTWVTARSRGPGEPNSALFAAASSSTAVLGYQQLYRTGDGGATYAPVGPSGVQWAYLGFTDATHGVALGDAGKLYYTTDGGLTYHLVAIG